MDFDEEIFEMHAGFCSLFSNVIRMKIFWLLRVRGECKVNELANEIGTTVQNISQHLRVMRDKMAVTARKEGRDVYYKVSNENFTKGAALIRQGVIEEIEKKSSALHKR